MRDTIMDAQNKAIGQLIMQLRGMAGEKALIGDLASVLAEDPEFAPWPGERFVTASAIRVIRSLRDRDESEVERDEASQRLFDCMAEDKMAEFVDDMYVEDDAAHYIKALRARIEDLEGDAKYWREQTTLLELKVMEMHAERLAAIKASGCEFPCSEEKRCPGEESCPKTGNAEKLSPEKWWTS